MKSNRLNRIILSLGIFALRVKGFLYFLRERRPLLLKSALTLMTGLLFIGFLTLLDNTPFSLRIEIENSILDAVARKEAKTAKINSEDCMKSASGSPCSELGKHISQDIVIIEFDDAYYRNAGEPLITPREDIARLLMMLSGAGAKAVLLDMLLDSQSPDAKTDTILRDALKVLGAESNGMKIVFPVRIDDGDRMKSLMIDDLIDANPNFIRTSPFVEVSSNDRQSRRIHYFETVTKNDHERKTVWSAPLMAAAVQMDNKAMMDNIGALMTSPLIADDVRYEEAKKQAVRALNRIFGLNASGGGPSRISYFVSPGAMKALGQAVSYSNAYKNPAVFKGKTVIVGASGESRDDMHNTPAGKMAGIYIMGNIANTLLKPQYNLPVWSGLVLEVLLLGLFGVLLSFPIKIRYGILVLIIIMPIAYFLSIILFRVSGCGVYLLYTAAVMGMVSITVGTSEYLNRERVKSAIYNERLAAENSLIRHLSHSIRHDINIIKAPIEMAQAYLTSKGGLEDIVSEKLDGSKLTLDDILKKPLSGADGISRALDDAKQRINSNTQIRPEDFRVTRLKDLFDEIRPLYDNKKFQIEVQCNDEIQIIAYRYAFLECIKNFIRNAEMHGKINEIENGKVVFLVSARIGSIIIDYTNNGVHLPGDIDEKKFLGYGEKGADSPGEGLGGNWIGRFIKTHRCSFQIIRDDNPVHFRITMPTGGSIL